MAFFLRTPTPLEGAIESLSAKTPIGSILRTQEWAKMPQQLRETAFFSAGVENIRYLEEGQRRILEHVKLTREQLGSGETALMDRSVFVSEMRKIGEELGVRRNVLPEDRGTLRDPLSTQRLRLIFDFQVQSAQGFAEWKTGQDPDLLDAFPAQELIRLEDRVAPRAWRTRWVKAGGRLYEGRMIATKGDAIWRSLSRFGRPYPPLDFNSGMGFEDIDRFEAEDLGVIDAEAFEEPSDLAFTADLEASVQGLSPRYTQALKNLFGNQIAIEGQIAKWVGGRN